MFFFTNKTTNKHWVYVTKLYHLLHHTGERRTRGSSARKEGRVSNDALPIHVAALIGITLHSLLHISELGTSPKTLGSGNASGPDGLLEIRHISGLTPHTNLTSKNQLL